MDEARLPAHLEVSGLIRAVEAAGGFGTVLAKGERDSGTLLIVCCHKDTPGRAFERMPQRDGTRSWTLVREQDIEKPQEFDDYLTKRSRQDKDLWIVELDIADAHRFIASTLGDADLQG